MTLFSELLPELGAAIAAVLLNGFLILACRNRHRPKTLRTGFAQIAAPVLFLTVSCLAFALLLSGLIDAGLGLAAALPTAILTATLIVLVIGAIFDFRGRLRRADAGENPFRVAGKRAGAPHAAQAGGDAR